MQCFVCLRTVRAATIGIAIGWLGAVALAVHAQGISAEDRRQIQDELAQLAAQLEKLRKADPPIESDLLADVEVFHKGTVWALRYDEPIQPADVALIKKALARGRERAEQLAADQPPWRDRRGRLARAYRSAVDDSVQPFGLVIPAGYDRARPIRLDVGLHGSTKPVGISELRFIDRFDKEQESAAEAEFIELHPLGRVENCYRWAGEADVLEAIEAVCRNYNIDRRRIVLRGMSMGASGAWHLGLKHPDRFVALGPYCGYVDTHRFSQTPLPHFVKVGALPDHQEKALHMLDSVDYAANAGVVPAIACMGEKDIFFEAHVLMGQAMEKEGLKMVNLISPGTGHVIDPATHQEQMRRIGEHAARGLDDAPRQLRFVTWTLKYSRCHWLQVLGLEAHYARAEVSARLLDDGTLEVDEPRNVTRFAILPPALQQPTLKLRVGGKEIATPAREGRYPPRQTVIGRRDGAWAYLGELGELKLAGKRPGLQGPIDDAFSAPFLCVRGTGRPWNAAVGAWSEANLKRFAYEWGRYLRGDLAIKNDTEVTPDDLRRYHLVLFGDPGSNSLISQALAKLPLAWTERELALGGRSYSAADHAPALIYPNPLPGGEGRYLVINSGHTFHEKEFAAVNYLLFPRLGDWAVLKLPATLPNGAQPTFDDDAQTAGYFDEAWQMPK